MLYYFCFISFAQANKIVNIILTALPNFDGSTKLQRVLPNARFSKRTDCPFFFFCSDDWTFYYLP